ncbi:MAG: hypothetical protein N3B16_12555 [Candidatus Aminicenantes bacterium]|nr:hypothetical protein [Candidatus Aminicenantes bacterium]
MNQRRAVIIFLILFIIYLLSFGAGFIVGKVKWVDYRRLTKSPFFDLSRTLEYRLPGYGDVLRSYRSWHNKAREAYIFTQNRWGLGTLIFINNFFIANFTMFVRALLVFPLILTIGSRFLQGAMFAQIPGSGRVLSIFITEFGGYFFKRAFISGLQVLGLAYLLSGVGILIGSLIEIYETGCKPNGNSCGGH